MLKRVTSVWLQRCVAMQQSILDGMRALVQVGLVSVGW
jgi:hypothetical protein